MKLIIKNFRSIENQEVDLAPITIVYGPNGAGKSSLLYALMTLKSVVLNPNQNLAGFFTYGFAALGGFEAVVFDHKKASRIDLGILLEMEAVKVTYQVGMQEQKGIFVLGFGENTAEVLTIPVTFPYPANAPTQKALEWHDAPLVITWNGVISQVQVGAPGQQLQPPQVSDAQIKAYDLATILNAPVEMLRKTSFVPLKRGFSKPLYSAVAVTPMLMSEDEVATALSTNKYLVSRISHYLESIMGRDFRLSSTPGTAIFSLDATDKGTGVSTELVNEGFGVNQTVYLLARSLAEDVEWVCVEEPEIHLQPTAARALAKTLVDIVHEEGKRFLISTHSEAFLTGLLSQVARGVLAPDELACYLVTKEKKASQFRRQQVNKKGQVEGGLANFITGELEDVKAFLKVQD